MSDQESQQLSQTPGKRKAEDGSASDEVRKAKARERQRRKRAKDRENAGLPAVQHRDQRTTSTSTLAGRLREGENEEEKKARIREAARLRQQKHRQAVRLRRQQELDNPAPLPHEVYYGQELIQMYDGPGEAGPSPYNAPSGAVFANTLLLALSCEPNLKFNLMRLYSVSEEEFPSLEQAFCQAFDHWNHARYAASHAAHYGQMPHGPPPAPHHPDASPPDEHSHEHPSKYSDEGSHAGPSSPAIQPNLDGRLTRIPQPVNGEDAPTTARAANGAVASAWPAMIPGAPPGMQTIYTAAHHQAGTVDAHAHPIPTPGTSQGYFLSHNPEPPHFRRHRATGGARNGEGGDGVGSTNGSVVDDSPPRAGATVEGEERDDDGEEGDEGGAPRREGDVNAGAIGPVDPQEEHHKYWHALMEARIQAEAHARERAELMHTQA